VIGYLAWLGRMIVFAGQFAKALIMASVEVAWDVVAPNSRFSPGIIEFPLRCRTELEITAMANAITLTPGTLTLAIRAEPPTLWVHAMYALDRDKALAELQYYEGQRGGGWRGQGGVAGTSGGDAADHAARNGEAQ
jgi:multicomponent Na+:H+ antiporter subunit E